MKLERSKNAKRNGFWGIISNVVAILLPFAVRTILIKELGADYLGLSSLLSSVLSVLNITELGFGTAIVYSMYKPLAEDDTETICKLLNYYKRIYHTIGTVMLVIGIGILPFLKYFIRGDVPQDINIYLLYMMYLFNAVLSYWLFAYKTSILIIYQRMDIKSKIFIALSVLMYVGQILFLLVTHSYYLYVLTFVIYTICDNIIPAIVIKINYPQYVCKGSITIEQRKDIRTRVTGLMITKIANVTRNAFDSIIVSAFFGLETVAIYNNYYYAINALTRVMQVATTSISAGVGNSVATEPPKKNLSDMKIINFWYMWIAGWFTVCLACLYQPFMRLWVGEKLMFSDGIMLLFAFYFLLLRVGDIQAQYFDAVGLWWHQRWFSVLEAIANIILNFIFGYIFGVGGVVLATILTIFLIHFCGSSKIIFEKYFEIGFRDYMASQVKHILITIIIYVITRKTCELIFIEKIAGGLWLDFIIKVGICAIVPNLLFLVFYFRSSILEDALLWIKARLRG